jgi:dTDP-4-dehydrorhamnose reductase
MLGHAVRQQLARNTRWNIDGTQKENPLATDYMDVLEHWIHVVQQRPYHYIVNCIGILKPAVDELDGASVTRAVRVNALFPHALAEMARESRILHLSTDGVFSGSLRRPYLETDPTDCPDAYGKTKALGECPASNVLNIRCSIVGRDPRAGKGLIEWVLRSPQGAELSGYEDQLWNGVTTGQFGDLCSRIIASGDFDLIRRQSGVHHFCPNDAITKYDLLCAIRDAARRDISIRRSYSGSPVSRILGTLYNQLSALYPGGQAWDTVLKEAL